MLERRHSDRFEIPGARVNYSLENGDKSQMPLRNITHGGICFGVEQPLEKGTLVEVDIKLPGGTLEVEWDGEGEVYLSGPAEIVFNGVWPEKQREDLT